VSVSRSICPDIYHPAVARDGLLTRLRVPGGILTGAQCLAAAALLDATGVSYFQVTNRANLQIRGLDADVAPEYLRSLVAERLVSANRAVDGIRNIMASPLAGIDPIELIDVRPLVRAWDRYLSEHPKLGVLSNKFSVGFDGGGSVSILDRPNDITLLAVSEREFLLHLAVGERGAAPVSVGVIVAVDECIAMLGAISEEYRRGIAELGSGRKALRLREVIEVWGVEGFLLRLGVNFTQRGTEVTQRGTERDVCKHLGIWPQKSGASYVGVTLLLGRIDSWQLQGLAEIASRYGSGEMRLTPWQNAIVPDVRDKDVAAVVVAIEGLGLGVGANDINGLLMACAGANGCKFAAGDTQGDAIALSEYLQERLELDRSLNIHLSGCDKSCAQHNPADITLWGCQPTTERPAGYRLCVGSGDDKFGCEVSDYLTPEDVRLAIDCLIRAYQERRLSPQESFRAFVERQPVDRLL
jgi:ferredoxin-nitrite reductase